MNTMRAVMALAVVLSCLAGNAWATSCVTPPVCARLQPESVFFIGELLPGDAEPVTLTNGGKLFRRRVRVLEALFGIDAQAREVPVLFFADSEWSGGSLLMDTTRRDGHLIMTYCGWTGDVSHQFTFAQIEFLRKVRDEPQGTGSIRVGVWGVEGAEVTVDGPVRRQMLSRQGEARFDKLPPGMYRLSAVHKAYGPDEKVPADSMTQVAAHSCAMPRIPLVPKLAVSGIVVNAQAEPVSGVPLWLQNRASRTELAETVSDAAGRFLFTRVRPGSYLLLTAGRERKTFFHRQSWESQATAIEARAGGSTEELRMELLDSGAPRTVRIRVTDEKGQPLAGAWLRNGNLLEYSSIGPALQTDSDGVASLPLFEAAQYVMGVHGKLSSGRIESVGVHVPAGKGDKEIRVKLGAGYSVEQ